MRSPWSLTLAVSRTMMEPLYASRDTKSTTTLLDAGGMAGPSTALRGAFRRRVDYPLVCMGYNTSRA